MRVLIIPEDPTHDQYILVPIVEQIFADLERPARIDMLRDPHLRGVDQALSQQELTAIIADNRMVDLFLVMVDRDCDRQGNCAKAEARAREHPHLLTCLAVQEVEVWMLALHQSRVMAPWREVRESCDPKERYADPFLRREGWITKVGLGRKHAMRNLGQGWRSILSLCPELSELREKIRAWLCSEETRGPEPSPKRS